MQEWVFSGVNKVINFIVENKEELLEVDEDFGQLSCFVPANEHFLFKYWDESVFIVNSFQSIKIKCFCVFILMKEMQIHINL